MALTFCVGFKVSGHPLFCALLLKYTRNDGEIYSPTPNCALSGVISQSDSWQAFCLWVTLWYYTQTPANSFQPPPKKRCETTEHMLLRCLVAAMHKKWHSLDRFRLLEKFIGRHRRTSNIWRLNARSATSPTLPPASRRPYDCGWCQFMRTKHTLLVHGKIPHSQRQTPEKRQNEWKINL